MNRRLIRANLKWIQNDLGSVKRSLITVQLYLALNKSVFVPLIPRDSSAMTISFGYKKLRTGRQEAIVTNGGRYHLDFQSQSVNVIGTSLSVDGMLPFIFPNFTKWRVYSFDVVRPWE